MSAYGGANADFAAAPGPERPSWYGWQVLLVDMASWGTIAAGGHATSGLMIGVGLAGLALGGPIVHWAHGYGLKGLGSLGPNVGAPALGGLLGIVLECGTSCRGRGLRGATFGIVTGHVVAATTDIAVLGRHPERAPRAHVSLAPTLTPTFDAGPGRLGVGAVGSF